MENVFKLFIVAAFGFSWAAAGFGEETSKPAGALAPIASEEYKIGVDDFLDISVIQPEKFLYTVKVNPDGFISFPYIGGLNVKGRTLTEVQKEIETKLAEGYMKYPIVYVSLKESRSRKFFVYGEVMKPGTYLLEDNTTVLRAISIAGGFTKYGSTSGVKLLRPKKNGSGYDTIKIDIRAVMDGNSQADSDVLPNDMVVVSE